MKKDFTIIYGPNLKTFRARKGLKQDELAEIAGITRPQYTSWEKKTDIKVTLESAERIAAALEVTVNDLTNVKTNEDAPEEIYRNIVEGNTEYILIPRTVLQEKYRLVAIEQINKDQAFLQGQFEIIQSLFDQLNRLGINPADVKKA